VQRGESGEGFQDLAEYSDSIISYIRCSIGWGCVGMCKARTDEMKWNLCCV
jgi:hypothetical protein